MLVLAASLVVVEGQDVSQRFYSKDATSAGAVYRFDVIGRTVITHPLQIG
ncbi:hypothetical protein NYE80_10725 [Paenibacillus sp. FSL H7-0357]|nr:hypothetical protein [Paenibacillus sp. FSL H7-0357]